MKERRSKPGKLERFTTAITSDYVGQGFFLALSAAFLGYTCSVSCDWIDSYYPTFPIGELSLGTMGISTSLCAAYSFRSRRTR